MRILLVSFIDDNHWSGMGRWTHRMAEALSRLGHQPRLWFAGDFRMSRRAGRLAVLLFPFALALRLWRRRRDFDAVVVHEPCGFWYGVLRRFVPTLPPLVLMCHNVESKHFAELLAATRRGQAAVSLATRIKTPLFRLWQSDNAIKLADEVVCLSSLDRDYIIRRLRRAPERVALQINGVACETFETRRDATGGGGGGGRVLFVGGWLDVKGRRVVPSIWSRVRDAFPQSQLTVVGSGQPAEVVLRDFAKRDRSSVTVVPRLEDEAEMSAQYAAHDLFLMPSLSEGSPLSLLEALASGLPVVAARVGGVPDIVTHDVDGLLFDIENAADAAAQVRRLLSEPRTAARLGRAGQERTRSLSWTASAQTLLTAIERAVSRVRPVAAAAEAAKERSVKLESEIRAERAASE
jgi:glycosyltransferase involved in cell wall biosynthesis